MNKKTLLGLSAIFVLLIGKLACSHCAGADGGRALHNQGGSVLRADGVPVSEVAAMLGHADSRMAERVYAKLPPDLLRDLLTELCQPAAGQSVPKAVKDGKDGDARSRNPSEEMPRGGIEPPTRGFSVPCSTD